MSVSRATSSGRFTLSSCPVCRNTQARPVRTANALPVDQCTVCGFQYANPQPSDAELGAIYGKDYFLTGEELGDVRHASDLKRATARHYLDLIASVPPSDRRRLLEVGCGHGDFLVEAVGRGFSVTGVEYSAHACEVTRSRIGDAGEILCGDLGTWDAAGRTFDLCVLADVIEHVRDPRAFLQRIHDVLGPDGLVFIATPDLGSLSARLLGRHWMEYKAEHLSYFDAKTLQRLLEDTGFRVVSRRPGRKILSVDYICGHFRRFPVFLVTPLLRALNSMLPGGVRTRPFSIVASGLIMIARRD